MILKRRRKDKTLRCPCGSIFFEMHGVVIKRHPRRFIKSRLGGATDYITCVKCLRNFCASNYMMLDSRMMPDPFAFALMRGNEVPRWVRKRKRRMIAERSKIMGIR